MQWAPCSLIIDLDTYVFIFAELFCSWDYTVVWLYRFVCIEVPDFEQLTNEVRKILFSNIWYILNLSSLVAIWMKIYENQNTMEESQDYMALRNHAAGVTVVACNGTLWGKEECWRKWLKRFRSVIEMLMYIKNVFIFLSSFLNCERHSNRKCLRSKTQAFTSN